MTKAEKPSDITDKLDWESVDLELEHEGEKIILPDRPGRMSIDDGIKTLARIKAAEETVYAINETVPCHFYDGLVAFARALKEKYGYSQATATPGFFGPKPPAFVHVKTGPGDKDFIQVPFGSFKLPNIDGVIQVGMSSIKGIPALGIAGQVKAKEKTIVMEIVNLTKQFSRTHSIYRGRSIILERDEATNGIDFNEPLEFFEVTNAERPILNRDTERLIDVAVLGPLVKSQDCRVNKISLKRGVLLSGPYGTGKSMTAKYVASVANESDWTFILCKSSLSLKYALTFAKMYQPCVVFAEDIDRMVDDRNEGANDLINDIDGVVGKKDEIVTVLTTNFADKIDKAMLRPGRLDTIVTLREPDAETTERLIRYYAGDVLDNDEDLSAAAVKMAESNHNPSTIAEIVKKAKLFMIFSGNKKITAGEIDAANEEMKNHVEILNRAREGKRELPTLETTLAALVDQRLEKIAKKVEEIHESVF